MHVTVNGRRYQLPARPLVAICVDGSEPAYIERAISAGLMPWAEQIVSGTGSDFRADCVVPSFTNPNNLSIVTGVPPAVHGICGNYFLDPETGEELMMNDVRFLRSPTIFKKFQEKNKKIAIVTAKDKLRSLLGAELKIDTNHARCFSSEKADQANLINNGMSPDVSVAVVACYPGHRQGPFLWYSREKHPIGNAGHWNDLGDALARS